MIRSLVIVAVMSLILPFPKGAACGSENLIRGGDFEQGMSGWSSVWAREPPIRAVLDTEVKHGGRQSVRIEHGGSRDWALARAEGAAGQARRDLRSFRLDAGRGQRQRSA